MSENATSSASPRKSYARILLLILIVLILLLVYGAGVPVLPFSAHIIFQNKNCDFGLTLHKIYTSLYPEFVRDESLAGPIQECEAYVLAASNEKNENWRAAYESYQDYLRTYPSGLYAGDAHEHSALVLMSIAKEEIEQKEYAQAAQDLDMLVSGYLDTSVSADALTLFSSTYTAWGTELREAGDFERSEQVLNDFKTAGQNYQQADLTTDAQYELAETYLAWGLDLQSQKQFEAALAKFNLAVSVDVDSQTQAKSSQRKLYVEWGNNLLEQKQFPAALEKFELAVSQADAEDDDGTRDALVNGRIRWAADLSGAEDFTGALEQLEIAKETASSDQSVEKALQDTYLAFSKSSGRQARIAIREALETICKKHNEPDLPIFGLNKDSLRFGIYGVEDQLPKDLAATTPGEMHYVACITTDNRTVESRVHKNIVLKVSRGYYYTLVEQFRVQVIWDVDLLKVDTGKSVAKKTLTGETPPSFSDAGGNYFYGKVPMEEFKTWLQSVIP